MAEYGAVAIATYLVIFVMVWSGFAVAIGLGFQVESAGGSAGVIGAAYVATKLTQPFRIAGALALTPLVAKLLRRVRPPRGEPGR